MATNGKREIQVPIRGRAIERLPANFALEVIPDGAMLIVHVIVGERTFEVTMEREAVKGIAEFLRREAEE